MNGFHEHPFAIEQLHLLFVFYIQKTKVLAQKIPIVLHSNYKIMCGGGSSMGAGMFLSNFEPPGAVGA